MIRPVFALLLIALCIALQPGIAFADPFGQSLCRVAYIFKVTCEILAVVGLLIFGIMLLLGKGTWGLALLHVVASIVFVGAAEIAELLGADGVCTP